MTAAGTLPRWRVPGTTKGATLDTRESDSFAQMTAAIKEWLQWHLTDSDTIEMVRDEVTAILVSATTLKEEQ